MFSTRILKSFAPVAKYLSAAVRYCLGINSSVDVSPATLKRPERPWVSTSWD